MNAALNQTQENNVPLQTDAGQVVIERASWRDLLALQRLSRRCFGSDAWPWVDMLAALITPNVVRLKATVAAVPIGYVIGDERQRDMGWIASIAVAPEQRRRGVGSRLLTEAEARLRTPRIRLALRPSNRAALDMYRQHGYEAVTRWPDYYRDGEEALVMEKNLQIGL